LFNGDIARYATSFVCSILVSFVFLFFAGVTIVFLFANHKRKLLFILLSMNQQSYRYLYFPDIFEMNLFYWITICSWESTKLSVSIFSGYICDELFFTGLLYFSGNQQGYRILLIVLFFSKINIIFEV